MSFVDLSIPHSGRPSIASELRKDHPTSKNPNFARDIVFSDTAENHHYAEGGLKAWTTVFGAACIIFVSFGYLASFGIYVTYYLQVLLRGRTADEIAWIGSLQMFFLFGGAIFGGSLGDKWGVEVVLWPSTLLLSLAVLLTSLCTEYWHFILCQGIFTGLMMGFAYAPAMAAVGQHFYRRRPLAMALSLAGGGLGGLLYPIILNCLLHETTLGYAWTQRVIGFIVLGLGILGCACVRPGAVKEPERKLFLFSAFKNPAYTVQIIGLFFCVWGIFTPFFYLPTYALQYRMKPELAFYLLAILNACSFIGRIAAGVAGNILGPFNVLPFSAYVCSLLIFCWIAMTSQDLIIAMAVLYGLFEGGIVALLFATLSHIAPRAQDIGTYIGQASFVVAFAGLTGTPINGAMINRYHSFTPSRIFSGICIFVGGSLVLVSWYGFGRKQSLARVRAAEGIERVDHENVAVQGEKDVSRLG